MNESTKNIVNDILRVSGGVREGGGLISSLKKLLRGVDLTPIEQTVLIEFARKADVTSKYDRGTTVFFDKNGIRLRGAVAECLRWASEHRFKIPSESERSLRSDVLAMITEELESLNISDVDELIEPMLVSYDTRDIKHLDEELADQLLAGDWGIWTVGGRTWIKTKAGDDLPKAIAWCIEKAILRKVIPYASR